jgi:hypothetical protein
VEAQVFSLLMTHTFVSLSQIRKIRYVPLPYRNRQEDLVESQDGQDTLVDGLDQVVTEQESIPEEPEDEENFPFTPLGDETDPWKGAEPLDENLEDPQPEKEPEDPEEDHNEESSEAPFEFFKDFADFAFASSAQVTDQIDLHKLTKLASKINRKVTVQLDSVQRLSPPTSLSQVTQSLLIAFRFVK